MKRPVLSVIGQGGELSPSVEKMAREVGHLAMQAGFRLITGGRGGVMEAVSRGARESEDWQEGRILGILPSYDRSQANPWVDVVLPTGLGLARNMLVVSSANVVLAIAGGSGTLSEIALAWQMGKPVLALSSSGGWASRLAGQTVDQRRNDRVVEVHDPRQAIAVAMTFAPSFREVR